MNRILIWGTGKIAQNFIKNQYSGEVIGFIETNRTIDMYMGKPVYDSREIPKEYDYIIIANSYATEIFHCCKQLGIETSRLIFLRGVKQAMGCTDRVILKEILLDANYTLYCSEFGFMDETFINSDADLYQRLNKRPGFEIQEQHMWPIISDKYASAGTIDNYFWQDLWAARLIIRSGIKSHFDIASRLDGFIAHLLAAEIDVTMIDIREFPEEVAHLHTIIDDATSLKQVPDGSIESMSALCSLEHFGLGRYGDPVDPEACFTCFKNIQKKLKKGGRLYISVPIGKERVEFNAHRIFYASTIVKCFDALHLEEFSCASQGKIEYNADIYKYDNDLHNGEYRYGLFYFVKK
jgi:hypothetical protein